MNLEDSVAWMIEKLESDGCVYQDDVVDKLVTRGREIFLRENADGNLVLGSDLLKAFRQITGDKVVWVRPNRYLRWRVAEDEPGREARG